MKNFFIALFVLATIIGNKTAKAQLFSNNERYSESLVHISAGIEGLYNINPGKNYYGAGFGGTLRGQYDVSQNLGLTFTTGFYNLSKDNSSTAVTTQNFKYVPVKLGIKAYFLPEFYFGGEVGVGYADPYVDASTKSHFSKVIAPAVGYESNHIEASLRYENINHQSFYVSMIGLRVAYIFNLK